VVDRLVFDEPALLTQLLEAGPRYLETDEADVVGDSHQQGTLVEVAFARDGVHLKRRPARVGGVDRVAVVDDALEHREGADAHLGGTVLTPRSGAPGVNT
jgi:hypothetical protein